MEPLFMRVMRDVEQLLSPLHSISFNSFHRVSMRKVVLMALNEIRYRLPKAIQKERNAYDNQCHGEKLAGRTRTAFSANGLRVQLFIRANIVPNPACTRTSACFRMKGPFTAMGLLTSFSRQYRAFTKMDRSRNRIE